MEEMICTWCNEEITNDKYIKDPDFSNEYMHSSCNDTFIASIESLKKILHSSSESDSWYLESEARSLDMKD